MPEFDNMEDLSRYLRDRVKVATGDVKRKVDVVYKNNIINEVYNAYSPKMYGRRHSLIDNKNIKDKIVDINESEMELSIWNEAPANLEQGGTPAELPELIEYGHGYGGNEYDYPKKGGAYMKPRSFTKETISEVFNTDLHIKTLRNALRKNGIEVK